MCTARCMKKRYNLKGGRNNKENERKRDDCYEVCTAGFVFKTTGERKERD